MSKLPPDDPSAKAGRNMINMSLMVFVIVGVMAYFIVSGRVSLDEPIAITATIVQQQTWRDGEPLTLNVDMRLQNNEEEGLPLKADSQCEIFRWFVADTENNLVQSQGSDGVCVDLPVTGFLDPKHALTSSYTLTLDPRRVRPGSYTLFIRFWGYELREPLTIN